MTAGLSKLVAESTDKGSPDSRFAHPGSFFCSPSASGRWAEWYVAWWLRFRGWRIEARNLKTPGGEIDLLAREGPILVIVEVKYRSRKRNWPLGRPQAARLRRAAQWLSIYRRAEAGIRIDLIEVHRFRKVFIPRVSHLRAAVISDFP
ncbi:MAG: YraN family protein [Planctomycetota bacterium]|nr:YraN family protein [Planctomycetota bacterium]